MSRRTNSIGAVGVKRLFRPRQTNSSHRTSRLYETRVDGVNDWLTIEKWSSKCQREGDYRSSYRWSYQQVLSLSLHRQCPQRHQQESVSPLSTETVIVTDLSHRMVTVLSDAIVTDLPNRIVTCYLSTRSWINE